ncbi:carbohydrate ABC transporter permease [Halanaerobium salsuginis]|jgi:multiple sugar transport system permease protein|uniref:Carbohydrate ABC transporter membrane protein 2, CUT1 family (TC 3.A.1.1.-) n=1 Tax=Halanaerobium salsuginis TaxID=29563 RepID=A0A1I4IR86_9FIRM|nr:carbohydrate ABC transporter permease [Halanaerobium salsuginis]SFL56830.1 carbohydrate ABC transporter membrane protein 2, CUT1 family (TC 3.A.1.1.-) [Halanaerobium salsuginis]
MKMSDNKHLKSVIYHICILTLGLMMFYPVLWMIASSFKGHANALSPSLIPDQFLIQNYFQGWQGFGDLTFATFFKNSFIIATTATIGQVILSAMTAYGFGRIQFKGRNFWFSVMIITLLFPQQVVMIPQYLMFNQLGWIDTFKPLILPKFTPLPFFVFLMVQFVRGLPRELDEAARIDGCGVYMIFFKIILPNIKPALITAAIFSFYWTWQDFFTPLLYIQSTELYPVSLALSLFADPQAVTNWGAMFAMATLSLLPIFLIFIFFQRYLVEGIATSGLKG